MVGSTDDPLESEADAVADQLVGMPQSAHAGAAAISAAAPQLLRECANCEEEEAKTHTPLQAKRIAMGEPPKMTAPPMVDRILRAPGSPLEPLDRAFFERRLSYDLSSIRIHADPASADSALAVNAHAYTVGQHIVFGPGRYRPATPEGRHLLAHELVHTIQQAGTHRALSGANNQISRSPRQVSRDGPEGSTGSRVGYVAVYLGGGPGNAAIDFHTGKGIFRYTLDDVGNLEPGEYQVTVRNLGDKVEFVFPEKAGNLFHFKYDIKPGQPSPSTLFPNRGSVTFTVSDAEPEQPQEQDPQKETEPRDPNATYMTLEDAMAKCSSGELHVKTFPFRGTRFGGAPLTVFRSGKDIVVKSYIYVRTNPDFHEQVRTLPLETFIGGVHLKPDEVVRVHTYEPKWYQLNITGSTSGDIENEYCLTGEQMLQVGKMSDAATLGNIVLTVVDAATLFVPVGKLAAAIGKPVASLAGRGGRALAVSTMLALKGAAPTAFAGIASRTGVVLVEEQIADQVASRAVSETVTHVVIEFSEAPVAQAATGAATEGVTRTATQAAAQIAGHTIKVTVVDAAGKELVSTLTTPTGDPEVDRMVEEAFSHTFDQTLDSAATTAARQGVVAAAPEIAAGFTQAQVRAFARMLGRPFSASEIAVLQQLWDGAARAGDQQILNINNARYLFNLQRDRFWRAVAANPEARAIFTDAGCDVSGGAPYFILNGRRIVLTIDHIIERQSAPQLALQASNLRLSFSRENSVVLRLLNQLSPF